MQQVWSIVPVYFFFDAKLINLANLSMHMIVNFSWMDSPELLIEIVHVKKPITKSVLAQ